MYVCIHVCVYIYIEREREREGEKREGKGCPDGTCQWRRCEFDPWVGKILWNRSWQLTPVLLPGKLHGQGSLEGYSLQGLRETEMTEQLSTHTYIY